MNTKDIIEAVLGFGIGWTVGSVLFHEYQLLINKIVAVATLIGWMIYSFKF